MKFQLERNVVTTVITVMLASSFLFKFPASITISSQIDPKGASGALRSFQQKLAEYLPGVWVVPFRWL